MKLTFATSHEHHSINKRTTKATIPWCKASTTQPRYRASKHLNTSQTTPHGKTSATKATNAQPCNPANQHRAAHLGSTYQYPQHHPSTIHHSPQSSQPTTLKTKHTQDPIRASKTNGSTDPNPHPECNYTPQPSRRSPHQEPL
ncbi:hypothetical protein BO78DRAFT_146083 [Aspergillus sclerotiicarbonarius CBS 121057]|uniref:Uncharacterized protein n=1 Tax=Aspergillus sclerotiicarbonarius (strain CBS 121057 / IBT 28362) TaxID=1448318 RepID=A0A319EP69_ASPSB|nr:hypothetical protein BO78DRAFT_146083 [Aspergillus sclerotiicarbonarius CBS 121057]